MSSNTFAARDLAIDHELAQLSTSIDFILEVTPIELDGVREGFLASPDHEPEFVYRQLDTEPAVLRHQLDQITISEVEDAELRGLLEAKARELSLQIDMLEARDTPAFRGLGRELYGDVDDILFGAATQILSVVPAPSRLGPALGAVEFLELAQGEIDAYRRQDADITMHAEIREGVSGVLVSDDTLLVSPKSSVRAPRARALVHHEVGTHLVTQVNGAAQPMKTLGTGLAGYDATQEGLAVLAEIACGELTPSRLRQLAGRVLAVRSMLAETPFHETFAMLRDHGFPKQSSFTTTMRVYRSGGLAKDACYLRGVLDLLDELREGRSLDVLFLGKFSLADAPRIRALADRGLLAPPRIRARWLDDEAMVARLARAAAVNSLAELLPDDPFVEAPHSPATSSSPTTTP